MNERQANAISSIRQVCRDLAARSGVQRPDLSYANRHNEQETTVLLERLRAFLEAYRAALDLESGTVPETPQSAPSLLTAVSGASKDELMTIPHIGPATAQKIWDALHG